MTTMIFLVSKQPMPNLRPTLCKSLNFGVTEVILIVSDEMEDSAAHLETIFTKHQLSCEKIRIGDVYDHDYLSKKFSEIMDDINGKSLVNLTGGTKMMSLALWQAASRKEEAAIFYVREDSHQGIWLKGGVGEFEIATQLSIDDIYDAHGYDRTNPSSFHPNKSQRDFARWLFKEYYNRPDVINILNRASSSNEDKKNKSTKVYINKNIDYRAIQTILNYAEKVNLLKQHEGYLLFPTRKKRKFICGEWLETVVEEILKEIQASENFIDDIATGFQANDWGETDVLVSRRKGLAVIECKTAAYGQQTKEMAVIKQTASQRRYGGLTTLNILVSLNKLKNPQALKRAKNENIHIIDGDMLGSLKDHLIKCLE